MSVAASAVVRLNAPLKNLDQAHKLIDNVLRHLGCAACLSGFDIRFTHEQELQINAQTLAINAR